MSQTQKRFVSGFFDFEPEVLDAAQKLEKDRTVQRILEVDYTVWKKSPDEIANRLAWLSLPETMPGKILEIYDFVDQVRHEGYTHALLLGMGGSSLAPELFRLIFEVKQGYLDLAVLDSTDPSAVHAAFERSDPQKTLFIVSTKSGGTIETMSFMKYCYNRVIDSVGADHAGAQFIAITDPGSGLAAIARKLNFRKIFLNDPDIGGRYSALSFFGLVPAALVGIDIELLLERSAIFTESSQSGKGISESLEEAVRLGTAMGVLALHGREKLTLILSEKMVPFAAWIEQLVAESTGKEGKGILPVIETDPHTFRDYDDRFFIIVQISGEQENKELFKNLHRAAIPYIVIRLNDLYDLGGEFYRWEFATALAGHFLKINPFDQPNVESAKIQARNLVSQYIEQGKLDTPAEVFLISDGKTGPWALEKLEVFFKNRNPGQSLRPYFSIQAFVQPGAEIEGKLEDLCGIIGEKFGHAVTVGYGPRFLHSTGQLHKGDSGNGRFIQIISENTRDLIIPDEPGREGGKVSFAVLKKAQAFGDRQALISEGRMVITFIMRGDLKQNFDELARQINRIA